MTNSRKAIKRADKSQGKIRIETGFLDKKTVHLTFCDDGDGIDENIEDRIFEPFVTSTAAAPTGRKDEERLLGTGLGLKIVHDIVTGVDGKAEVIAPPKGFSTAIRVSVPAATAAQMSELYDD